MGLTNMTRKVNENKMLGCGWQLASNLPISYTLDKVFIIDGWTDGQTDGQTDYCTDRWRDYIIIGIITRIQ